MRLTRIGYWSSGPDDQWPDVNDFIDASWDADERARVLSHLRHGLVARAYLGRSLCRICGQPNGSTELTDGTYLWPEGLAHYVDDHGVRLPVEFAVHVSDIAQSFDDAEVDDHWWQARTGP
jgi:hypothetical protein